MKDKGTAAVLAFFLGIFGIHRFYLGQAGLGIVYFLLCWTPIIWIITAIDFLVFLTYSTDGFNRKYNRSLAPHQATINNQVHVYNQSPPSPVNPPPHRPQAAPKQVPQIPAKDPLEQLERLHKLKEKGILTAEEFAAEKAKVLGMEGPSNQGSNDPFLS